MKSQTDTPTLQEDDIVSYLTANPGFFNRHPDLLLSLAPPKRELGDGVLDFQHHMLKTLQSRSHQLKSKYEILIDYCRDNMSVQQQVHHAVLGLISARTLEQLLEIITVDLVALFDVDVVRLAMESEQAGLVYDTCYSEDHASGIVFVDPGLCDAAVPESRPVLLVGDAQAEPPPGFEQVFSDCDDMIASCALVRLDLPRARRQVLLAFGVRYAERFSPSQGSEMLDFLGQIVAHQLDLYLDQIDL